MKVLKGSPFAIGIAPGIADAAKSTATIEAAGRSERRLEAGQELVVSIQLRDAFGNPTVTVGEQLDSLRICLLLTNFGCIAHQARVVAFITGVTVDEPGLMRCPQRHHSVAPSCPLSC